VSVAVAAVNDSPSASNVTGSTNEDAALTSTLPAATDADGNVVTYNKATNPSNGTATVTTAGSYTYTPTANYSGPDSFTYTVSDGQGGTNTYTVSLTVNAVNDAPVVTGGSASTTEDTPTTGTLSATDVDNANLTYAVVTQPANGSVNLGANGSYTYTPAANFNGADNFTFRASDGALSSNTSTVSITVAAVNDAPVVATPLADQAVTLGSSLNFTFGATAFTDVETASLAYSATRADGTALPSWLTFNAATRTFTGTPASANLGTVSIKVTASDGSLSATDAFDIAIKDNPFPIALSFSPLDGAKSVPVGSNLSITFNKPIQLGSGPITLKAVGGAVLETFTAENSRVSGNTLTLDPKVDLSIFTNYVIGLGEGAVKDTTGIGNLADSRYDFKTATVDGLYHFCVVAFGVAPGATYMADLAEAWNYGLTLRQIVDIFTTKSFFLDLYPANLSNQELATRLVQNIVKSSAPEPTRTEGISDIQAALDYGLSRGEVIYNVFGNLATRPLTDPAWAAKWGGTAKQFQNQLTVARHLTEVLEVKTTDMSWLRAAIADITPDTDVSTVDKIVQIIGTPPPGG
jgi:VCBS repeat-containing protein